MSYVKVGYFTSWGIYDEDFPVARVPAHRLTHLNYAFGAVTAGGECASTDPWADWQIPFPAEKSVDGVADVPGQPLSGNLHQLAKLKARHPGLRVLISLGGWTGSAHFSDAARTESSRRDLVRSCVDLWLDGNIPGLAGAVAAGIFDGVDLDWEWPGSEGADGNVFRPEDRHHLTLLAAEFRRQLGPRRVLTAFLPASPDTIDAGFEPAALVSYLDFATVQGYDYHGSWEPVTNHQAGLYGPGLNADDAIKAYISRGVPRRKLVLGLPYYGRGWTGVTGGGDGRRQPGTPNDMANYRTISGMSGYRLYRDARAGEAWIFDGDSYWTLDDPVQMRQKTDYIRSQGLGGAMMWSLDGDDVNASLTRAIDEGLR